MLLQAPCAAFAPRALRRRAATASAASSSSATPLAAAPAPLPPPRSPAAHRRAAAAAAAATSMAAPRRGALHAVRTRATEEAAHPSVAISLGDVLVQSVMTPNPVTVLPTTSVFEVLEVRLSGRGRARRGRGLAWVSFPRKAARFLLFVLVLRRGAVAAGRGRRAGAPSAACARAAPGNATLRRRAPSRRAVRAPAARSGRADVSRFCRNGCVSLAPACAPPLARPTPRRTAAAGQQEDQRPARGGRVRQSAGHDQARRGPRLPARRAATRAPSRPTTFFCLYTRRR
jgi:CBS domain-containing protein